MVVGPRYVPEARVKEGEPNALELGQWNLPASAPVALPDTIDPERVRIQVHLDAGLPVQWIDSPSHVIDVHDRGINARWIRLAAGRTIANQDFSLRFGLAAKTVAAGVSTWAKDGQGVLGLLIEPPAKAKPAQITRREMVFVLDCSGSMSGIPMDTSKRFMRQALSRLRPDDHFRIIRFSHRASAFAERPMKASPANVQRGLAYVNQLRGQGGTEMTSGIRAALDPAVPTGSMRIVVFLTDGYIGNEVDVTRLIQQRRGEARLFSFGIGNSVNRYLLSEMARAGRGVARFVRPDQDPEQEADRLAERLQAPLLTDVEIDWGDAPVSQPTPRILPDLFMGERLRVLARYDKPGEYTVTVRGKMAGKQVSLPLRIELPALDPDGQALDILWARSQVEDRMIAYLNPGIAQATRETLRSEVIGLGLEHKLVTQWTAFVAVAKEIVNPGGQADPADVAVPQVKGVSNNAYPLGTPTQKGSGSFFGSSAPEPATWAAILLLLLLSMVWLRR
jgi:Ca-activated chloride channel family protein